MSKKAPPDNHLIDPVLREKALNKILKAVDKYRSILATAKTTQAKAAPARQLSDALAAAFQEAFALQACLNQPVTQINRS